jgi:hypothetical protein
MIVQRVSSFIDRALHPDSQLFPSAIRRLCRWRRSGLRSRHAAVATSVARATEGGIDTPLVYRGFPDSGTRSSLAGRLMPGMDLLIPWPRSPHAERSSRSCQVSSFRVCPHRRSGRPDTGFGTVSNPTNSGRQLMADPAVRHRAAEPPRKTIFVAMPQARRYGLGPSFP